MKTGKTARGKNKVRENTGNCGCSSTEFPDSNIKGITKLVAKFSICDSVLQATFAYETS